jgi:hypothetical protein
MTYAKISTQLVQDNAEQIIANTSRSIEQQKRNLDEIKQNAIAEFQTFSWLRRLLHEGQDRYVRNVIMSDRFTAEDYIASHKRNRRRARSLLMLATQTIDGSVYLSPDDAWFLNIDPEV